MMKRKKLFVIAAVMAIVLSGSLLAGAKKTDAGGYSYLDKEGNIDLPAYFSTEGAEIQLQEQCMDFVMSGEEATVTFNKPLLGGGFTLAFAGVEGNTLEQIQIELTDMENPEEKAVFCAYAMSDISSIVKIDNTNRPVMINGSFFVENAFDFYIRYDAEAKQFTDGTSYYLPIIESLDGDIFSGFSSEKVNLTIRLYGESGSVFRLKEISRQRLGTSFIKDTESPTIAIVNSMSKAELNSTITLPRAVTVDVLADNAEVTMSVVDPDKEIVKAVDGTKLEKVPAGKDYKIKVSKIGRYKVSYQATDGTNKSQQIFVQIVVPDNLAPEITLSEEIPASTKAKSILALPEVTYEDKGSEEETIKNWTTVKYPDGVIMEVGDSVELAKDGVYEITFSAIDETGNIGRLTVKTYAEGEESQ